MYMSKCGCNNCMTMARREDFLPCIQKLDPPKQETIGEYKTLKKMLEHFKERNDQRNKSLADSGERKHCRPLKTIDVQELKDYMLTILEKEMNV